MATELIDYCNVVPMRRERKGKLLATLFLMISNKDETH